ncbi:mechanosensitive ion channel family protein [Lysobacter sp. 1R34A]|uniref:mechanosensitive ion channel family protein n=1 Tax=Lysobacter sp. 1R34A TaxID=3445786 RepID=UPI003EEB794F
MLAESYRFLAASPLLLVALLLTVAAWWFGGWLSRRTVVARVARHNPFLKDLLASTIKGGVVLLGLSAGLQLMNATAVVGALLGTAGVVGIALGFAFKDIIENYIAGVLLSLRQPFRPHDHVRIAEHEGLVAAMTARATVLMTLDGNNLRVPNSIVFKSVILNYSQNPSRRFEFDLSLPAGDVAAGELASGELARIRQRVAAVDGVLSEPAAAAFVVSSADGKATVRVRAWVDQRHDDIDEVRGAALREAIPFEKAPSAAARRATPLPRRNDGAPKRADGHLHLVRAGNAMVRPDDLLDPSAPAE